MSEFFQRFAANKADETHFVAGGLRVPFGDRSKMLFNDIPATVLKVAASADRRDE